jgi:hypothetical protein
MLQFRARRDRCVLTVPIAAGCYLFPVAVSGQSCTVTSKWALAPGSTCINVGVIVTVTEASGPHKGRVTQWQTQPLNGVCAFTYEGCNTSIPASNLTVTNASPTIKVSSTVVSASELEMTVTESQPQAEADPTPCNCHDTDPQGYNGVSKSSTDLPPILEVFYVDC